MGYYDRQIAKAKANRRAPTTKEKKQKHIRTAPSNGHLSAMRAAGYTARMVRG